jgi:hypothetical protein
MTLTTLLLIALLFNQAPGDPRGDQFKDPLGATWKVFAVDSYPDGPLVINEVQEIKQQNPPSTWAVFVKNRSLAPVPSYSMAAAIVSGDGTVRAIQPLPAIKNLAPNSVRKQEVRVRVTNLVPSDRVVFFVSEATGDASTWKAVRADVDAMIRTAVKRLPAQ